MGHPALINPISYNVDPTHDEQAVMNGAPGLLKKVTRKFLT